MEEDNKKPIITTIRFSDDEVELHDELRIWALKNRVSMAEAIKKGIRLLLQQEGQES
jgi:hypothetical protein